MKNHLKLAMILTGLLFIAGCNARYQTYMLINGEVSEEHSTKEVADTASEDGNREHEMEVTRYVLVDKLTGRIFYFNELMGDISVYDPVKSK